MGFDPEDTANEIDTDDVIQIKFGENDLTYEIKADDIELTNEKKPKEESVASLHANEETGITKLDRDLCSTEEIYNLEGTSNENDTYEVIEKKFEENEGTNAVIPKTNNADKEFKSEGNGSEKSKDEAVA